ncbi:MAG: class I SAM-dependent methyltransferase [Planctomycetes bacterium]|nr:class I SAM-dependent methyltransferase [Planctomycetota bacterium]
MPAMDRLDSEQRFHDRQALRRADTFACDPARLHVDDAWLDHETWVRPAFAALGDVAGLRVLDYGCGHGMASVVLARRGADVTAFDLSPGYLAEARARAQANGVRIDLLCADAERLPFADGSFDRVWGNAVLHHLDLDRAARELRRVLRPGGWAVFCEPWGGNPLLNWARARLPYPGKGRTPDEHPLRPRDLRPLRRVFPGLTVRGFQLLSMVRRVLRPGRLTASLERIDERLLTRFPALQRFCRYVVLTLRR